MNRTRGFTLLELMVVVAVVAILAGFAISSYSEQIRKGKRSEAAKAISELQLGLEKYRSYCPTYADQVSCRDRNADGDVIDAGEPPYPSATSPYYTVAISGQNATDYVITATKASSFTDPKCGNFTMTYASGVGTKGISSGDVNYCWKQ